MHVFSGHVSLAEDLLEVLVSHSSEVRAIFRRHAQYHGISRQRLAVAFGIPMDRVLAPQALYETDPNEASGPVLVPAAQFGV
jgi:hypothetical protein